MVAVKIRKGRRCLPVMTRDSRKELGELGHGQTSEKLFFLMTMWYCPCSLQPMWQSLVSPRISDLWCLPCMPDFTENFPYKSPMSPLGTLILAYAAWPPKVPLKSEGMLLQLMSSVCL